MSKSNLSVGTKAWTDRINLAWREGTRHAIDAWKEVGVHLWQAKEALPHGDFEKMIKSQLDFTPQTARKLMAVAIDKRVSNSAQGRALPSHWTTYYELTKLSDDELDQAFASGVIAPEMRRSDVPKKRRESPQGDAVSAKGGLAPAREVSPHDDSEGGDAVVTEHEESDAGIAHGADRGQQADGAVHCTRSAPLDPTPAAPWPASAKQGKVAYYVEADNPASALANGLSMAMSASRELGPTMFDIQRAVAAYPKDMPLYSDDLDVFCAWLFELAAEFRALYDRGNDAALAAE